MMHELNGRLAYVVGDSYSNLAQLPGVMTVTQFSQRVLDGSLPLNFTWMMGQGLNAVERNLLQLCKTYRSDICFYTNDKAVSSTTILSKWSRFMMSIMKAGKKSIHRLCAR